MERSDTLLNVLDEVNALSESMLHAAHEGNWQVFVELSQKRETLLQEYENLLNSLERDPKKSNDSLGSRKRELAGAVREQFEKLSKVNAKIFDIIECKKEELIDGIAKMNKGLDFLRKYKKRNNSGKLFTRTY